MAFATIRSSASRQTAYEAIELSYQTPKGRKAKKVFNTGNPIIDYYDFVLWLTKRPDQWYEDNFMISWSSSYDHFFMGGKRYVERYFKSETFEFLTNKDLMAMPFSEMEKLQKCICLSTHKNFTDVKRYYKKFKGLPLTNLYPEKK